MRKEWTIHLSSVCVQQEQGEKGQEDMEGEMVGLRSTGDIMEGSTGVNAL